MIICKSCGKESEYTGAECPGCKSEFLFSDGELGLVRERLMTYRAAASIPDMAECLHILADNGDSDAAFEYASLIESGKGVPQSLDGAMKYFRLAAQKNHRTAAYRYSKLASRTSDRAGRFWLLYSAVLGESLAYNDASELLDREENYHAANYFLRRAAEEGSADAAVSMAKRHLDGVYAEPNEGYAKWYLSRFAIPPINALVMAYKLRAVEPKEPPHAVFSEYSRFLSRLAAAAKSLSAYTAYFTLTELLLREGADGAKTELGRLYFEGVGCEANIPLAVELFESAIFEGSAEAAAYLADAYIKGEHVSRDVERAIECLEFAGKNGIPACYEMLGDLYCDGRFVPRDIARAIELFDTAAGLGVSSARAKADKYKDEREEFYRRACQKPTDESFKFFAISAAMGYIPAERGLALCYEVGFGTKIDRPRAFHWYKSAVEGGHIEAAGDLGRCYALGIGTQFDMRAAIHFLTLAERRGDSEARELRELLLSRKLKKMTRALYSSGMELLYQKKFSEAARIIGAAAELGDSKSIYTYGCFLEFGIGVGEDRERAFSLYEDAYKKKFRDPRQNYKLQILRMIR